MIERDLFRKNLRPAFGIGTVHSVGATPHSPYQDGRVLSTAKVDQVFKVKLEDGTEYIGWKLIIATGSMDLLLPINGAMLVYHFADIKLRRTIGTDFVHCVCSGGYEHRDKSCATIGLRSDMELDSAMKALSVACSVHLFPHLETPTSFLSK